MEEILCFVVIFLQYFNKVFFILLFLKSAKGLFCEALQIGGFCQVIDAPSFVHTLEKRGLT